MAACQADDRPAAETTAVITADFTLRDDQTHNKFSRTIEPAITVPSGSIIEAFTHEATGGQLSFDSTTEDIANVDMDRVHTLTGPVYVDGAEPGDVLAVQLLEMDPGDWGWMDITPGLGFLAEEFDTAVFRTFALDMERGSWISQEGFVCRCAPSPA